MLLKVCFKMLQIEKCYKMQLTHILTVSPEKGNTEHHLQDIQIWHKANLL